jgi:hypothetical protein
MELSGQTQVLAAFSPTEDPLLPIEYNAESPYSRYWHFGEDKTSYRCRLSRP